MNTPAHLLLGGALLGRGQRGLIWAAFAGAMLPDLSLYVMAGVSLSILGIPAQRVFNELYFSDAWQTVFAIDNSFILWSLLLAVAVWKRSGWGMALTGAALLHLALDFPLHHDDGRPHFWPLSDWVFESPFSYWDRGHGAMWIAPLEAFAATLAAVWVWTRRQGWKIGILTGVLLLAELQVVRSWLWFFVDS